MSKTLRPVKHAKPRKNAARANGLTPAKRGAKQPGKQPSPRGAAPARAGSGTTLAIVHVDAFAGALFTGNPACVVLLEKKISDELMQRISTENNQSETAFVIPTGSRKGIPTCAIRWFTPACEVDLCGHATLAAAHVLWNHVSVQGETIVFTSRSGPLPVHREDAGLITLDFPRTALEPLGDSKQLCAALGTAPVELFRAGDDLLAAFENRRQVYEMTPDFAALEKFKARGVIVTAPGSGHDFVSRFFAPRSGINEDPVTGSAHCALAPFWAQRLGKNRLHAHQVSKRGGELWCTVAGDRVHIAGHARTYMQGMISVP